MVHIFFFTMLMISCFQCLDAQYSQHQDSHPPMTTRSGVAAAGHLQSKHPSGAVNQTSGREDVDCAPPVMANVYWDTPCGAAASGIPRSTSTDSFGRPRLRAQ